MNATIARHVGEIDAHIWDGLCDDPVFSHGWFRALEESGAAAAEARHIILRDGDRVVGILPCFVQRGDPHYSLADRLFGRQLVPWFARIGVRALPALVAYSPLAHRTALFLATDVSYDEALRTCLETMERTARAERLPMSAWMFVPGKDSRLRRALHGDGYRHCFLAPYAFWTNRYDSFERYLDGFRSTSRTRSEVIRREMNRFAQSGVSLGEESLTAIHDEQLASMIGSHYGRYHPDRPCPFTPLFFQALKRGLGGRIVVQTARKDGHLISCSLVFKHGSRWHMFLSGDADTERAHADKLHFNLNYYFPIQLAITSGVERLDYGLGSLDAKVRRGCELEPLELWVRPHSPALGWWLPRWLRLVDRRYRGKHSNFTVGDARQVRDASRAPWWRRWSRILAERHTFVLIAADLAMMARDGEPSEWHVRRLTDADDCLLEGTVSRTIQKLFKKFRREGYRCFGAWRGSELGAYQWVTTGPSTISGFFGPLQLEPGAVMSAYIYVWPTHRGNGLSRILKHATAAIFVGEGSRVLYTGTITTNLDSLKGQARIGARPFRLWHYRRIGPWRRRWSTAVPERHPVTELFAVEQASVVPNDLSSHALHDPMGSKPRPSAWQSARSYWRRHGFRALAQTAGHELAKRVWERETILEWVTPLQNWASLQPPRWPDNFLTRRLRADELPILRAVTSKTAYRRFEQFMADDFDCHVAFMDGQVVGFNWYTRFPYHSPETMITYPLEAGEEFLIYSYTVPEWRGRGIDSTLKAATLPELQGRGVQRIRTVLDERNRVSLRMVMSWGSVLSRRYHYRRILGWRRVRMEQVDDNPEILSRLEPGGRARS